MALGNYIKETRAELKHVSWPTRNQAIGYSIIVIGISLGLAALLGFCDYIFTLGVHYIVTHFH